MPTPSTSDALTHGIRVTASAFYMPDESDPESRQYRFGYRITIYNEGTSPATLTSRRWLIIDADGNREEVEGPGVIGQTPRLEPGQGFKYTSYCPLKTTWGTMEGSYHMERDDGSEFDAHVGRFFLVIPKEAAAKV
jgi:ApaG protein